MTPCQFCGKPATIHLTDILNKTKTESHICEACAKKKKILPEGQTMQLNVQALVQLILGQHSSKASTDDPETLVCPECGIKFVEFRAVGRLGCARDYTEFAVPLAQLLGKVHRATEHNGKMPKGRAASVELDDLRKSLKAAIAAEEYERAAELRDRIRQKEVPG
jgi:protein arginine kinase activator